MCDRPRNILYKIGSCVAERALTRLARGRALFRYKPQYSAANLDLSKIYFPF